MIWALLDDHGCVTACGINTTPPPGAVAAPENPRMLMCLAGEWSPRPTVPEPVLTGTGFVLAGLPEGTITTVYDLEAGTILGTIEGDAEVVLPDPALYAIEILPPKPWLPVRLRLEQDP